MKKHSITKWKKVKEETNDLVYAKNKTVKYKFFYSNQSTASLDLDKMSKHNYIEIVSIFSSLKNVLSQTT